LAFLRLLVLCPSCLRLAVVALKDILSADLGDDEGEVLGRVG
jgi:hypothetical protein